MDQWTEIRRRVLVNKQSKRSVCLEFGIHWDTLVKMLEHAEPPGSRQRQPRDTPKIGPLRGIIDALLRQDQQAHHHGQPYNGEKYRGNFRRDFVRIVRHV